MIWTERDLQLYRINICADMPCDSDCDLESCTKTKEEIDECFYDLYYDLLDEYNWDNEEQVCD